MRQFTADDIERAILARRNKDKAQGMQPVLQTKLEVVGLERIVRHEILKELKPILPEIEEEFVWLNLLQDLWESPYFEARLIALELLYAKSELVDAHLWGMLDHWTNSIDNWILADWLGHLRAVAIFKANTLVMRMAPWLQSGDPWRRRSALVSLLYIDPETNERNLLLGPHEIFAFIDPVLADEHKAVRPALFWLLKEIDNRYPQELQNFLNKNTGSLPESLVEHFMTKIKGSSMVETAF